jgi:hypothetical protein
LSSPAATSGCGTCEGGPLRDYGKQFRVEPGTKVDLGEVDAGFNDKSLNMRFPKPSVDIEAVKRKYHEIAGKAAAVQAGPGDHVPQ